MRFWTLGGQVGLLVMVSVLAASCGEYPGLPRIVAGAISTDRAGGTRPLTSFEVTTLSDWLTKHRSGWTTNVATSPPGTLHISLDAAAAPAAVRLTLWPGPKYPGWNRAVLLEVPAQKAFLIQSFSDRDLAPIGLVAAQHHD
jgi:hypothetical protein